MKLDIAVHQVQTSYLQAPIGPSDERPQGATGVVPQDAIGGIYGKVLDGTSWMARFDDHPLAIRGGQTVAARVTEHAARGRRWVPWANVTGVAPSEEGRLAAVIAKTAEQTRVRVGAEPMGAVYIANVEPYQGFWPHRNAESAARAKTFLRNFQAHGGEELWLWVDARDWQLRLDQGMGFEVWYHEVPGLVTRVLPEVYWTDFEVGWGFALNRALRALAAYEVPETSIFPTLPGNANPSDAVNFVDACYNSGLGPPNVWQRLSFRPETAVALARHRNPWPADAPPPPRETVQQAFERGREEGVVEALRVVREQFDGFMTEAERELGL